MGITSEDKNSQPPKGGKARSLFGDLPEIIGMCIRKFGEDNPLTLKFKQQLIDLTKLKQQRESNPNHYEEEEEQWHAGMVPNLRPKSEKGLEEDEDWDDSLEEDLDDEDSNEDWSDSSNPDSETTTAEPDLSPTTEAEINQRIMEEGLGLPLSPLLKDFPTPGAFTEALLGWRHRVGGALLPTMSLWKASREKPE